MKRRNINNLIDDAMADTPVVLLNGPRQSGKSTLALGIAQRRRARYYTLDDVDTLSQAANDPAGFIAGTDGPVVIDEIQLAPKLFPTIKASVDRDRRPGRFLLTGSADVLLLPSVSESLAGRMEIITLWPFSAGELRGKAGSFVDVLFSRCAWPASIEAESRYRTLDRVLTGGFPEVVGRKSAKRRTAWFASYVSAILQRDVREIANIERLPAMPKLLKLLATRSTSLLNVADVGRSLILPHTTLQRYMALLEMTYLVQYLQPWSANLGNRVFKTPKAVLSDTGLMAHLLGAEKVSGIPATAVGPLVENYVVMELRKQLGWSQTRASLYYFREQNGKDVDVVLESAGGQIAAVEVNAASTVTPDDFKGLRHFRKLAGDKFVRGVVLYTGANVVPVDATLHALPLAALWSADSGRSGTSGG